MFERATRLCRMSPQIATVRPCRRPNRRRIVRASNKCLRRVGVTPVTGVDHRAVHLSATANRQRRCPNA